MLADFVRHKGATWVHVESWQDFVGAEDCPLPDEVRDRAADKLRVLTRDGVLLEGLEAWEYLVGVERDLTGLAWLVAKLGLSPRGYAQALDGAGRVLRMFCRRCGAMVPIGSGHRHG